MRYKVGDIVKIIRDDGTLRKASNNTTFGQKLTAIATGRLVLVEHAGSDYVRCRYAKDGSRLYESGSWKLPFTCISKAQNKPILVIKR